MRGSGDSPVPGFGLGVRLQIWRMWIRESGGREGVVCLALCGVGKEYVHNTSLMVII